jgi:hypothetical protein
VATDEADAVFDVGRAAYQKGKIAMEACAPLEERVALFERAAAEGDGLSAYYAAMLRLFGHEDFAWDYRLLIASCHPTDGEVRDGDPKPLGLKHMKRSSC